MHSLQVLVDTKVGLWTQEQLATCVMTENCSLNYATLRKHLRLHTFELLQTVIALAVQNGLKLHQMDVTTAFLNGELEEEIYMRQPEVFATKGQEDLVCKLKRSIYGLKQSSRCWNTVLNSQMGFAQAKGDPCIYVTSEGEMFIIAVYIYLAGKGDTRMTDVKEHAEHFQVKNMGELHYFLAKSVLDSQRVPQPYCRNSAWNMQSQ